MLNSDKETDSKFIAGGRLYFEADVFGYRISSIFTKGFLDQENYHEPVRDVEIPFY